MAAFEKSWRRERDSGCGRVIHPDLFSPAISRYPLSPTGTAKLAVRGINVWFGTCGRAISFPGPLWSP
jgi:hypothetical protein